MSRLIPVQGRSAFEPPEDIPSSGEWRNAAGSPNDFTPRGLNEDYVQQYDAKGHPVNQQSRDYGRAMRSAQNYCLAAVGIAVKKEKLAQMTRGDQHVDVESEQPPLYTRLENLTDFALEVAALRWVYGIRDRLLVCFS